MRLLLAALLLLSACSPRLYVRGETERLDDHTARIRALEAHAARVDQWTAQTSHDVSKAVTGLEERVGKLEKPEPKEAK